MVSFYVATNGIEVPFVHQSAKYDYNHCLFVFSGLTKRGFKDYRDFSGSLDKCPCDVIWIIDYFDETACDYMCLNSDFSVRDAVVEFIKVKLKELNIPFNNASVTGFSKGGSAALYYGLTLPFRNIVATVPQIEIGSYAHKYWPKVAKKMMGENYTKTEIIYMDNIIKRLLKTTPFNKNRNIYLLTSESDIQYKTEIEPFLDDFRNLGNFFCFKSFSIFCREHNQITSHHVPFLLSLFYLFANNLSPEFSGLNKQIYNYYGKDLPTNNNPSGGIYLNLITCKIDDNKLFIDGVFALLGYSVVDYSDVSYMLILNGITSKLSIKLGSVNTPRLTKDLFDGNHFTIYDKTQFATMGQKGIDLSAIPPDKYHLSISIKLLGIEKTTPLVSKKEIKSHVDNYNLYVDSEGGVLEIC